MLKYLNQNVSSIQSQLQFQKKRKKEIPKTVIKDQNINHLMKVAKMNVHHHNGLPMQNNFK